MESHILCYDLQKNDMRKFEIKGVQATGLEWTRRTYVFTLGLWIRVRASCTWRLED